MKGLLLSLILLFSSSVIGEESTSSNSERERLQCIAWIIELNEYELDAKSTELEAIFLTQYIITLKAYHDLMEDRVYNLLNLRDVEGYNEAKHEMDRTKNYIIYQINKRNEMNELLEKIRLDYSILAPKIEICPPFEADFNEIVKACDMYKSIADKANCSIAKRKLEEQRKDSF